MEKTSLQYYCGNCKNILKEIDFELEFSSNSESCPFCGIILSDTIQKRFFSSSVKSLPTVFKKASHLPKLILDVPKLDETLHFLTLSNKVCISGTYTQKLLERICVRAQLPPRYSGLDSKVLLVDGANSSDLYLCVDFAQQYGLDVNKILDRIISSRVFPVYQLANIIIKELHHAIKQYDTKIVIITNLLYFFTDSLYLDTNEMKTILKEIIETLDKIQNCLVVVSLGCPTQYDYMFSTMFSRIINIQQNHGTLSILLMMQVKKLHYY